jgi:hypothetical protein
MLAARVDRDIVAVQEVGAQHFAATGTVSTGSWVGPRFQDAGYGKAMRKVILHPHSTVYRPSEPIPQPGSPTTLPWAYSD